MKHQKYEGKVIFDQWSFTHAGFHMIWNMSSDVWIVSFNRLNLYPNHHL